MNGDTSSSSSPSSSYSQSPNGSATMTTATTMGATPKSELQQTFVGFQKQLQSVLEIDFFRDDSLVKGALQMIHSKIGQMLVQALVPGPSGSNGSSGSAGTAGSQAGSGPEIVSSDAHVVLDLTWKHVHYPIFKYFQNWRSRNVAEGSRPNYAGHRQLNSVLQKIYPHINRLYQSHVELIFAHYDLAELVPSDTKSKLIVSSGAQEEAQAQAQAQAQALGALAQGITALKAKDPFSIDCVMALQRCLLYIGCAQRYKIMMEHLSDKYQQADFQKPFKYFDIAFTIVPSVGETFLQRGICYTHTKNFGNAAYQFVRSSLSRIPSDAGVPNFKNLLGDSNGSLFKKLLVSLDDLKVQETIKKRIINMEIMEFYILPLIGSYIFPQTWKSNRHSDRLKHFQTLLFDKIEIRYIKNISMIFQDLILLIGSFHINQMINPATSSAPVSALNDRKVVNGNGSTNNNNNISHSSENKLLEFIFKFFTHLIDKVIMKEFKNSEMFQYLAMVRIMMCWIKSHKNVLRFAHRYNPFCQSMANLTNELLACNEWSIDFENLHRPTRSYFYEEDIMLKEFSPVKFNLSDFNDEKLLTMDNLPDRLAGKTKSKPRGKEEHLSRVQVVVYSNKKFLEKNCCGFKLDAEKKRYTHTAVKRGKANNNNSNSNNNNNNNNTVPNFSKSESAGKNFTVDGNNSETKSFPQKNGFSVAFTSRDNGVNPPTNTVEISTTPNYGAETHETVIPNNVWNYSGSSVPQAPMTFNVAPSFSVSTVIERHETVRTFNMYNKTELSTASNSTCNSNGSVTSHFSPMNSQNMSSNPLSSTNTNSSSLDSRENSSGPSEAQKLNVQNLSTFNNYLQNTSHDSHISIFARDNVVMSSQASNSAGLYEQAHQRTYMGSQYAQFHNPFNSFPSQFDHLHNAETQPQNPMMARRDSQFFPNNGSMQGDHLPSMAQKVDDQFNFFFYT